MFENCTVICTFLIFFNSSINFCLSKTLQPNSITIGLPFLLLNTFNPEFLKKTLLFLNFDMSIVINRDFSPSLAVSLLHDGVHIPQVANSYLIEKISFHTGD